MTARYLALAGLPEAVAALRERHALKARVEAELPRVFEAPGLALFAASNAEVLPIANGGGFVIGHLHDRADRPLRDIDDKVAQQVTSSRGQSLIESHWGTYAAFLAGEGEHSVIREPSGGIPVYYAEAAGIQVYGSDAAALLASRVPDLCPDSGFAAHWLAYPYLRTARTGLAGVKELLPGTRRCWSGGGEAIDQLWSPWRFAAPELRIDGFEEAAERLAETLRRTVAASADGYGRLLLELSGGLDSSLVAAALHQAGLDFSAANFVTASSDGDERRYARLVADSFSVPLAELVEEENPVDLSPPARVVRPGLSPLVMPLHRMFEAHATSVRADAFITGAGGDNVFCYLTTAAPIVDALRDRGVRHAFGPTARDVAAMNGCTWWTAVRLAAAKALRGRRRPMWKASPEFLAPEAIPPIEPHPWLQAPRSAGPGQREHVAALLRIQHFLDPEIRTSPVPSLHPLMSQPLMELCLRIPSWMWVRGGRNRAVARHAMRDLLPPEILSRSTKGRLESMCARAYSRSRSAVAQLLLDGRLAAGGLLDRPAVETYLRAAEPRGTGYFRIMELAATELWLRSWDSETRR